MPSLSVQDLTVGESDGFADVLVRLDAPVSSTVTVAWTTADGTAYGNASSGFDYLSGSGTLVFAPGETEKTVRISLRDSAPVDIRDAEWNEWFRLVLSNPVGATLAGDGSGWITVIDNDSVTTLPQLQVSDLVVDERDRSARFVVTLGRERGTASNAPVTVDVSTRDGSALAGSDYTALATTLRFAPGETVKTVSVPLADDALAEGSETFVLQLSNVQGGAIGRGEAVATIAANDAPAVVRPLLSVQPAIWGEGTPWLDVPVTLSAPSSQRITVRWQTVDDTATQITPGRGGDYYAYPGLISFEPGQTVQVVRLRAEYLTLPIEPTSPERAVRFAFQLSDPVNAVLAHEGGAWVTLIDNDTPDDAPLLHVRDVTVDEAQGQALFAVTLGRTYGQASTHEVKVDLFTADGSAVAGADYRALRTTLTFQPGESVQTVAVPLVNDSQAERAETFFVRLENVQGGTLGTAFATVTIGANDAPASGRPVMSVQPLTVSEADRWADVVITLSTPSASRVGAAYALRAGTAIVSDDVRNLSGTVVFEPGETTRVVTLDIGGLDAGPTGVEPWERLQLVLSSPVGATLAGDGTGWIDIVDNDTVVDSPEITVHDLLLDETQTEARFVVTLGRDLGSSARSPITLDYVTRSGLALDGEDFVGTRGTLTFLPGESAKTVVVPLLDDRRVEPFESFELVVSGTALDGTRIERHGAAVIAESDPGTAALPAVSALSSIAVEDEGWIDLWVMLDKASTQSVSVRWDLRGGTADIRDFGRGSGTLVFDPGVTALPVRVAITNDTQIEPVESASLVLSSPTNARLGTATATLTIVDARVAGVPVQALGGGDDRYQVFAPSDLIVERPFGGLDTVVAACDYTLPAQLEVLVMATDALAGTGNAESNFFVGNAADNRIDGQAGIDTMVYRGPAASYAVAGSQGSFTVGGGDAGRDTLTSIERIQFADRVQVWDTTPGGRAFTVGALLNAGFGRVPEMADVGQWTAVYDQLARDFSGPVELAQRLLDTYVPEGLPDEVLVAHLWLSVVGGPIDAASLASFTGLLRDGTYTQASLFVAAADHPLNTADLVALTGQPWTLDAAWFPAPQG